MSIRRAPFHDEATRLTPWKPPAWRTLAGYPGATGTNDGPGIGARFSSPTGIATDTAGNAYVADTGNCAIRKISPAGIVSTVAGQAGIYGWQDGLATNAMFAGPSALALDADGNLYVADSGNFVLRKISTAGIVTTVAGRPGVGGYQDGTGTNALFGYSFGGLARDTNGNLYVADSDNYVLRKVSAGGVVSTLAGQFGNSGHQDGSGTNAVFGYVKGLALDRSGNLYVADPNNCVIRKVSPAGIVTTWAGQRDMWGYRDGNGTNAWFSSVTGLTIDSLGNVYVAETDNRRIRKITPEGEVSSLGGASSGDYVDGLGLFASFNSPCAAALDPSGNLLVVDSGNSTIRYGSLASESRPQIISQPGSRTVREGDDVTLNVAAQSAVPLTYQWLANGQLIAGATNTSLVRENLTEMDAGEYRVAVSDGLGNVMSFPASLQVLRAGSISHAPLDNWHPLAGPPLQEIHGLASGNGRYVAVGGGNSYPWWIMPPPPGLRGAVATSTDGEHWVKQFPITSEKLNSVAFGNGTFVVVGNKATVFTSTNGLAWLPQTLTTEGTPDLDGIVFDQDIFVAVSGDANGSIWTSTDGSNWVNRLVDFGVSFMAVTAEGGRFLAVGNTIMVSTNGLDWEPASVPTNYLGQKILLEHVACANGTFQAAEHWGYGFMAASTNGLDWVDAAPTNGLLLARVTCGNGQFVAVDMNSGGVSISSDGKDWSAPTLVSSGERTCYQPHLCFDNGLFVATGEQGAVFISSDGNSWVVREQEQAIPFVPQMIINVGERYFGVSGGPGIETSTNGSDWRLLLPNDNFNCIGYGGGTLVAIGDRELILSSQDGGTTWSDRSPHLNYGTKTPWLSRITFGGGIFVAVGGLNDTNGIQNGHLLASSGGTIWTPVNFAGTNSLSDVTYGDGLFVALLNRSGVSGDILTSTNGFSWKTAATFPNTWLNTVSFGNARFVVGASSGNVVTSPDGKTWSQLVFSGGDYLDRIVFGNGLFLASGYSGLWSSLDGVTWTECAAPPTSYFQGVAVGQGVFLTAGEDAILYQSGPFERLGNPRWLPNGDLEWTVTGAPHLNYRIEFSEDLINWQTLTRVTNAPATRPFNDPDATARPGRFYRTVTE